MRNLIIALLLLVTTSFQAQDAVSGNAANGEKIFNAQCAACHKLDSKFVGPALGGVVERLQTDEGLGRDWLHAWIHDNAALRATGDEYANRIFEEYNGSVMTPFPQLSEQDIDDILEYTTNPPAPKPVVEEAPVVATGSDFPAGMLIVAFAVLAALLIWILFRVRALYNLTNADLDSPLREEEIGSVGEWVAKYKKVAYAGLGIFAFLALLGLWDFLTGIGVDKGYKPEQPIYFSHKIHAGEQGIDCQMCHTSAKYGKVSGIPSTNVCMNCHFTIQEYQGSYVEAGKTRSFYTSEIQKIYESSGFDPGSNSYTGEQQPIEWVRVHNMPDFVYFNHAQHVVAGEEAIKKTHGVDQVCYACHGRVDQMDELYMANDFTMGWCIECHRATDVDMNNEYNKEYYAQLHEKIKKEYGEESRLTVDAIGGLECAKCHY
ncbi:MAG: c-type cytochrome [Weeksellaceae bacterium]|nr:c-type cytochrome [Weeksellaceae bacterium]